MSEFQNVSIGVVGLGKLGSVIARGLRNRYPAVQGLVRRANKTDVDTTTDANAFLRGARIVILAVKPAQAKETLSAWGDQLTSSHLLISVCAGLTTQQLEEFTQGRCPVVRAVTNTPCLVGEGMTGLVAGVGAGETEMRLAREVFSALGRALVIPESKADAMTGIAGCGPAFVFQILEGLMDAGIRNGLAAREALEMAAQTLIGASQMVLQTGQHPSELRNQVTTPGGATIEGVVAMEKGRVRATLIEAVTVSVKRAKELGGLAPKKPLRPRKATAARKRSASTPARRSALSSSRARRRPKKGL